MQTNSLWTEVKASIKKQLPDHSYNMWIDPIEFNDCLEGNMVVTCPNVFSKKRVTDLYSTLIESELTRISKGQISALSFEISNNPNHPRKKPDQDKQLLLPNFHYRPHSGRFLRRDFTFDHFVVGNNNDFAYSASLSLASRTFPKQNTLFLLSKTGMGKSHLSQAVGNHILSSYPEDRVYYITAEDFTNELIQGFRNDTVDQFKDKYRTKCDVLLLEDVHYLTGKDRTQIELALTIDTLLDAGKKIIFTSCYAPSDIPKLNDKLESRLSSSLISNIEPPPYKTRLKILKQKCKLNGYSLPEEIIDYLATTLVENVRQLESGVNGIATKAALLGSPITMDLAESVIKNIIRQTQKISIEQIKSTVSKYFKITVEELISKSRKQNIVRPRQIAMYLSRRYTDHPLQSIGKSFNRYHATALHAIGLVEKEIKMNRPIKKQVEFLCDKLENNKL